MKLTRNRLLFASVAAVVVIGGAWFARSRQPSFVTFSAYYQIQLGMPIEDVEQVIGRPADAIPNFPCLSQFSLIHCERKGVIRLRKWLFWSENDNTAILVWVDEDGLVEALAFYSRPTMRDRLMREFRSYRGKLGF